MHNYEYKKYNLSHFNQFIDQTGEIGIVEAYDHPYIKIKGLPKAKPKEVVLFESGTLGHVESLDEEVCHIVSFSHHTPAIGERVCRTNAPIEFGVGEGYLGKVVDSLGRNMYSELEEITVTSYKSVNPNPLGIDKRVKINQFFETGVAMVDMLIPLGKGQRELIIGDRKTGKTEFLLQTMLSAVKNGYICIYAGIAKNALDIKKLENFMDVNNIRHNCTIVASYSSDPPALVYLNPYSAMTLAEYFMENGKDVLLILDDLTDHAKYYRELSLVGRKFPSRSAYPADIFFTHSRLLERAGCFKTPNGIGTITCLPVAETVEGDISGYIQTNLMSITDGHIFFDEDLFLQGIRPAINYFLSVTRVGRQTQTKLKWSVGRELANFLTLLQKTQSFVHFGAEINQGIKSTLAMGEKLTKVFFNQMPGQILETNLQLLLFSLIWSQTLKAPTNEKLAEDCQKIITAYQTKPSYKSMVDDLIAECDDFNKLLGHVSAKQNDMV